MKLLLHLAASLAAIVLIPRPAGAQSTVGNLTCFRINDPMPRAKFQVTLGGEAGSMHCTLKAPANRACIATSGTVVSPPPPEAGGGADVSTSFLCYQARCSPGPGAASLEDAFGRRAVALVAPKSLCLPASSGGFTTTTRVHRVVRPGHEMRRGRRHGLVRMPERLLRRGHGPGVQRRLRRTERGVRLLGQRL